MMYQQIITLLSKPLMFSIFRKYNTFKYGILNTYMLNFILYYEFGYKIIKYELFWNYKFF
jgi:hypothetical protein